MLLTTTLCAAAPAATLPQATTPPMVPASDYFERAITNDDVNYTATRTSLFWSDSGKTRALVAHVYKRGNKVRYVYPARGNQPTHVIIETPQDLTFISGHRVTVAHRQADPDINGIDLKLALNNFDWRYEESTNPSRVIVAAYRPGESKPLARFWIAPSTDMVVRAERYGDNSELRSSWLLDQVHTVDPTHLNEVLPPDQFDAKVPNMDLREISVPTRITPQEMEKAAGFAPRAIPPAALPRGYQLADVFLEQNKGSNSVRMVYSDGLDSFSLLEAPNRHKNTMLNAGREVQVLDTTAQVVTSAEANIVHWQDKDRIYTMIGSQSQAQLMDILRGIIVVDHPPPAPPPRRSFGQVLAHGWNRLLHMLSTER
jgi:hypothetical protein